MAVIVEPCHAVSDIFFLQPFVLMVNRADHAVKGGRDAAQLIRGVADDRHFDGVIAVFDALNPSEEGFQRADERKGQPESDPQRERRRQDGGV